jgi:hypothetical protein
VTFQQAATIYAAMVATGGLGWQVWTWRQGRRSVVVSLALRMFVLDSGPKWMVGIRVVNHHDHVVQVTSAGLLLPDGREWVVTHQDRLADLPGPVSAHDSGDLYVSVDAVEKSFEMREPLKAWATLSTGETVHSRPVRLLAKDTPAGNIANQLRAM